MTTLTDTQVVTASGGLVELGYSQITSDVNVVSTTAGSGTPVISALTVVCDGGPVLVEFFAPGVVAPSTSGGQLFISLYQDGSEKSRYWSNTSNPAAATQYAPAQLQYRTTPSAGSHTFDVRAFVSSTTGTPRISAANTTTGNAPAFLRVSKIVQATQWPAVTTGTIICTSTTRPASPFEGQTIYETDTKKTMTYNGSGWYAFNQVVGSHSLTSTQGTSATHTTFQDEGLTLGSISYPANRRWKVSLSVRPYPNGGLQGMQYQVVLGSTVMDRWIFEPNQLSASLAGHHALTGYFDTPSTSGTDTLKVQFRALTTNTQVSSWSSLLSQEGVRRFIVEDIGPA